LDINFVRPCCEQPSFMYFSTL